MNEYKIEFDDLAEKQLCKLDKQSQEQIISFLESLLIKINENGINPFLLGKPLMGDFKGLYRFRSGNFRLICKIKENKLIIYVLKIGHRKDIYES